MSTTSLSSGDINLFEMLKLKGPDGKILEVAEVLNEVNDAVKMLPAFPANGNQYHEGIRDIALPSGEFSYIGGTWGLSKGTEEKYVEQLCLVRSAMEIKTDVLKSQGPQLGKATINHKKRQHIEGLSQSWSNLILKGVSAPNQLAIVGLEKRAPWNAVDNEYTFDIGGSGDDLRSAWLIAPGPATCHLLYNPLHPTLGVEAEEKPESRERDADDSTKHYYCIPYEFMYQGGISIPDQRAVKRLANIPCAITDNPGIDVVNYAIEASLRHNLLARSQWILFCDANLYAKLVRASNAVTKIYTDAKNIWNTDLPTIGTGKGSIVIARWDSLNYAPSGGESSVS